MPVDLRTSMARILALVATAGMIGPLVTSLASAQTPCTFGPSGVSGTPDCNFGGTGLVTTALPGGWGPGTDVIAQPDGKLVVIGQGYPASAPQGGGSDLYVLRYNVDGSLDGSFGNSGIATVGVTPQLDSEYAQAVVLQTTGGEERILVVGSAPLKGAGNPQFGVALVRFTADGRLDTTFGTNGRVQFGWSNKGDSWGYDAVPQCDGRIVVAGRYGTDMGVARLLPTGAFDQTFGSGGKTVVTLGKASAGDTIGGANGIALQPFGTVQPSGCPAEQRIVLVGTRPTVNGTGTSRDMAVVRLLTHGGLDATFGSGGRTFIDNAGRVDYGWGVGVDAANRIVVSGFASTGTSAATTDFAVARLTTSGMLDPSFGIGGKVTTDVNGSLNYSEAQLAIDSGGRILVSGISQNSSYSIVDFTVVRYNDDGSLDATFGTGGAATVDFGIGSATENWGRLTLDPSGRIVVVGSTNSSKLVATAVLNR
jgi:uncharacterized delta-60 repeat protein